MKRIVAALTAIASLLPTGAIAQTPQEVEYLQAVNSSLQEKEIAVNTVSDRTKIEAGQDWCNHLSKGLTSRETMFAAIKLAGEHGLLRTEESRNRTIGYFSTVGSNAEGILCPDLAVTYSFEQQDNYLRFLNMQLTRSQNPYFALNDSSKIKIGQNWCKRMQFGQSEEQAQADISDILLKNSSNPVTRRQIAQLYGVASAAAEAFFCPEYKNW